MMHGLVSPGGFGVVAALYVSPDGPYFGRNGVVPWDEAKDARRYADPWPVVAHPPCKRWGRFATGGFGRNTHKLGDDGGCFDSALSNVRRVGGVLEHPQGSYAWPHFHLPKPPVRGWSRADLYGGRSIALDQGAWGHKAKKPTWLYAVLPAYPAIPQEHYVSGASYHSKAERLRKEARSDHVPKKMLPKRERELTPEPFAALLVALAKSCASWSPPAPRVRQLVLPTSD